MYLTASLQWRHNEHDGVSNHRRLDCLLNRLFGRRSKKTSKLRVNGLCEGNPSVTRGISSQRASNAESVSIWWRHHVNVICSVLEVSLIGIYRMSYLYQYCLSYWNVGFPFQIDMTSMMVTKSIGLRRDIIQRYWGNRYRQFKKKKMFIGPKYKLLLSFVVISDRTLFQTKLYLQSWF